MYPSEHKTSEFGSPIALPVVEQIQYPSAAANPIARAPLPIHLDEPRHYKMQQNSIRQLDSISGLSYSQYNQVNNSNNVLLPSIILTALYFILFCLRNDFELNLFWQNGNLTHLL